MAVSGTNQSKNIVSPLSSSKYGISTWGDSVATWGDSLAYWGDLALVTINQTKNALSGSSGFLWAATTFPWQEVSPWTITGSSVLPINQTKN